MKLSSLISHRIPGQPHNILHWSSKLLPLDLCDNHKVTVFTLLTWFSLLYHYCLAHNSREIDIAAYSIRGADVRLDYLPCCI